MLFNSLGSNYDLGFVKRSLFTIPGKKDEALLLKYLEDRYEGKAILLYKGREAIKMALMIMGLGKNAKVGVTGLTCYVVVQAIKEAGYEPEYIDIVRGDLNFNLNELKKHKDIRILIIQNTLGIPCDITNISKYCRDNSIYLIEDLAHSIGSKYADGREAGKVGDFTALSFSQDKSVDGISGGALIIRNPSFLHSSVGEKRKNVEVNLRLKDRFYPLFTTLIRFTYPLGLGRFLHHFFKKLNFLSNPMGKGGSIEFHKIPYLNCSLILHQYGNILNIQKHRKIISATYTKKMGLGIPGVLRWPFFVKDRKKFFLFMKKYGVHISDTWYEAPVAPVRYLKKSGYIKGSCPIAEEISKHIVNLPTHINISQKEAERVSDRVIEWIKLN